MTRISYKNNPPTPKTKILFKTKHDFPARHTAWTTPTRHILAPKLALAAVILAKESTL